MKTRKTNFNTEIKKQIGESMELKEEILHIFSDK